MINPFAIFKAYSTIKQAIIAGVVLIVICGALYGWHIYKVNAAWNEGFDKGEISERLLWEDEVTKLRLELAALAKSRQDEVDRITQQHAIELAAKQEFVDTKTAELSTLMETINREFEDNILELDKTLANNEKATAEALANSKKGNSNAKRCIINPYAERLDPRILRNHNERRKRFN